jgi:hypothetical protein
MILAATSYRRHVIGGRPARFTGLNKDAPRQAKIGLASSSFPMSLTAQSMKNFDVFRKLFCGDAHWGITMGYDCSCDYDAPAFYHCEIRKARKPHKCEECGGPIIPGDRYEHVRGCWEGYVSSFKTCERCRDIRVWTKNNVPCLCWAHGNMIEDCQEAVNEAAWRAPAETVGLRFGFLRRIVGRDKFNKQRSQ